MLRHREGQTWECSDCGMAVISYDGKAPKHTCTVAKAKIARGFERVRARPAVPKRAHSGTLG